MCGFAGFLDLGAHTPQPSRVAAAQAATLIHRGPDDDGVWTDDAAGIALAFRRLAILDLSPQGHQPMASHDGRFVITFNGEIYNHAAIRARLDPTIAWRGHSDTEVLLEAVAAWGVDKAVAEFDGMFAFALWDRRDRVLTLGRDRFGEKPLYWGQMNGRLLFGSELKALRAHPAWDGALDRDAMADFMRLGWIRAPATIYTHARKLMPGSLLEVRGGTISERRYWSAEQAAAAAEATYKGSYDDAVTRLEQLLVQSVELRMQADVPVGVFLSGGIDSSLLAALMRKQSAGPVLSFTIGFDQAGIDESPHAKAVADHIGTDHTEVRISDTEALGLVPRLGTFYDEPFADAAALPTLLLAQVTRNRVTVALSGDGADELFGGYGIYRSLPRQWDGLARWPAPLRALAGSGARALAPAAEGLAALTAHLSKRRSHPGFRLGRLAEGLGAQSLGQVLQLHYSRWRGQPDPVPGAAGHGVWAWPAIQDPALGLMVMDALAYLPDDLCVKTDRATMAASIEARLPFLAVDVAAFAWSLPSAFKLGSGSGKRILRDVLYRHVPSTLVDRPKMGFEVPLRRWLGGQLKEWASDLLSPDRLRRQGWLDAELVSACWAEHAAGTKNWQSELWHALMLQAWSEGG
jgi:asparagine synthase (glutamine-hydrolysing)